MAGAEEGQPEGELPAGADEVGQVIGRQDLEAATTVFKGQGVRAAVTGVVKQVEAACPEPVEGAAKQGTLQAGGLGPLDVEFDGAAWFVQPAFQAGQFAAGVQGSHCIAAQVYQRRGDQSQDGGLVLGHDHMSFASGPASRERRMSWLRDFRLLSLRRRTRGRASLRRLGSLVTAG